MGKVLSIRHWKNGGLGPQDFSVLEPKGVRYRSEVHFDSDGMEYPVSDEATGSVLLKMVTDINTGRNEITDISVDGTGMNSDTIQAFAKAAKDALKLKLEAVIYQHSGDGIRWTIRFMVREYVEDKRDNKQVSLGGIRFANETTNPNDFGKLQERIDQDVEDAKKMDVVYSETFMKGMEFVDKEYRSDLDVAKVWISGASVLTSMSDHGTARIWLQNANTSLFNADANRKLNREVLGNAESSDRLFVKHSKALPTVALFGGGSVVGALVGEYMKAAFEVAFGFLFEQLWTPAVEWFVSLWK